MASLTAQRAGDSIFYFLIFGGTVVGFTDGWGVFGDSLRYVDEVLVQVIKD